MRSALLFVVGLVLAGCCGRGTCSPDRARTIQPQQGVMGQFDSAARESASSPPTGHPDHVAAVRYRTWFSRGGIRAPYIGHWVEALWFPDWRLEANLEPEEWDGPPQLNVFQSEYPHAHTQPGLVFIPTGEDPRKFYTGKRETVQVPWDLAQAVKATFDLQERLRKLQRSVGGDVERSGLIRGVKEGDTRQ